MGDAASPTLHQETTMPRRRKRPTHGGTGDTPSPASWSGPTARRCSECGHRNPGSASYCAGCGYSFAPAPRSGWRMFLPLVLVAATIAVYANSLDNAFLFDDEKQIVNNKRIRDLGNLSQILSRRRPVTELTLAVNYHFGKLNVRGYHVVNLAIHLLAGLTLYGIIRRTLLREPLCGRYGRAAPWLALSVALLWLVHPLQTESVTYVIQRAESLMGLFYLVTVYCVVRGAGSSRGRLWYFAAVIACAMGMGSKAVMVTAPVAVLLFDRVFLSKSFAELVRRRGVLHLGLAATWSVLGITRVAQQVLGSSYKYATVGFGVRDITPFEYAMTQPGAILQYLRLSFWPVSLCLDYEWAPVRDFNVTVLAATAGIVALLALGIYWLFRKPALGFVIAWFFMILAPTSSFIPIADPVFEHRMYLPLISVILAVVFAVNELLSDVFRRGSEPVPIRHVGSTLLVLAAAVPLGYGTIQRNKVYANDIVMWKDVIAKRPENERGYLGLGSNYFRQNKIDDAETAFRKAIELDPTYADAHYNLGNCLFRKRLYTEAAEAYRESLRVGRGSAATYYNLANALKKLGQRENALKHYRRAIRLNPRHAKAMVNMGNTLREMEKLDEALEQYHRAVKIAPSHFMAHYYMGVVLGFQGELEQAIKAYDKALKIKPKNANARNGRERILQRIGS
ncbi:MAG: tetratricopeptide repeat protein [Planctomycetes bacterium]|nr:tetratricopeptide repeat protein [Planctomycetota bacterium]